jgi:hypothetical protein
MSLYRKLDFRWLRPYKISYINTEKGYYKLKELGPNKAYLRGIFLENRAIRVSSVIGPSLGVSLNTCKMLVSPL